MGRSANAVDRRARMVGRSAGARPPTTCVTSAEVTVYQPEPTMDDHVLTPSDIEIRLGADLRNLSVLRAVAANIALRADFDLDSVEDTKLAVDEMCSTLITRAVPAATLTCCFLVSDEAIGVHAFVSSPNSQPIDQRSLGWRVLTTLTDSVNAWITDSSETGGHLAHIEIRKAKQMAPGE